MWISTIIMQTGMFHGFFAVDKQGDALGKLHAQLWTYSLILLINNL